jgi:adenosine deaminase
MPKVELHVHLEGTMGPETLLALAREHAVELPASDAAGVARWFRFRDFDHFVEIFVTCSRVLRRPEDFHRLALDFLAGQARQNVVYTEAHFTISTHLAHGADGEGVLQALEEARSEGRRRWGVELALVPDIVRNLEVERADATVEWALAGRGRGVVALGIAGIEAGYENAPFVEHFAAARRGGLHRVAHAGEHGGPESIRSALDELGAERIDHGVRSVDDPALVARLAREAVPLDVCPSSNVCLGVFPDLASHSFDRLYRAGVPLTVGSDDPPFFATTLSGEYRRLAETFGYGAAELAGLSLTALRSSFLPEEHKARLEQDFRRRFAELGEELVGVPVKAVKAVALAK